ncbi:TetR/AcrR family transcriptional regulator [Amycolatopsis sp. GM8]|uniref:TetR/AcrR family transcriptional regulator n=1 Tax=Amycolatopsis sp. GM8 TaxID=2896530 RepID=UPI001F25373B|nr:TetR/AcrR family transcriptional regulator [Amycolatopsis sp. GM8]
MTKIRSRQQLIDAAAKVFAEKGYDAARLEDIAAELDVLQGSLYYHVGSKAALYRLVLLQRFETIIVAIEKIAAGTASPEDKLRQAIREQLRYLARHRSESAHWFDSLPANDKAPAEAEEDRALLLRLRESWKAIIREGIRTGAIRKNVDASVAVLSILGMTNYVARWYDPDDSRTIDQIADTQFAMVWDGLAD